MKIRNFLLNLTVALSALLFGLMWVGVYQYFTEKTLGEEVQSVVVKQTEQLAFDITNPESVLPIDFEEDKLSDPKEDEDNPTYFDPEGRYYLLEDSKIFGDFFLFTIQNKNFEVTSDDERFGDFIPPQGTFLLEDTDKGKKDNCDMHDYFDIPKIKIEDGKINFITKKKDGITYEFKGEFVIKGNFYTLELDEKVLKGTLMKKKNGKIIAKEDLKFGWSNSEMCLH